MHVYDCSLIFIQNQNQNKAGEFAENEASKLAKKFSTLLCWDPNHISSTEKSFNHLHVTMASL